MSNEKIILKVHLQSVREIVTNPISWDREHLSALRKLLRDIEEEEKNGGYDRILTFEYDPWRPRWNPEDPTFYWQDFADIIGKDSEVTIVGVQRYLCVQQVCDELLSHGVNVKIAEELTWDSREEKFVFRAV